MPGFPQASSTRSKEFDNIHVYVSTCMFPKHRAKDLVSDPDGYGELMKQTDNNTAITHGKVVNQNALSEWVISVVCGLITIWQVSLKTKDHENILCRLD